MTLIMAGKEKMGNIIVENALWQLLKNDDGSFTLKSTDGTISVQLSNGQLFALTAIITEARKVA